MPASHNIWVLSSSKAPNDNLKRIVTKGARGVKLNHITSIASWGRIQPGCRRRVESWRRICRPGDIDLQAEV